MLTEGMELIYDETTTYFKLKTVNNLKAEGTQTSSLIHLYSIFVQSARSQRVTIPRNTDFWIVSLMCTKYWNPRGHFNQNLYF